MKEGVPFAMQKESKIISYFLADLLRSDEMKERGGGV